MGNKQRLPLPEEAACLLIWEKPHIPSTSAPHTPSVSPGPSPFSAPLAHFLLSGGHKSVVCRLLIFFLPLLFQPSLSLSVFVRGPPPAPYGSWERRTVVIGLNKGAVVSELPRVQEAQSCAQGPAAHPRGRGGSQSCLCVHRAERASGPQTETLFLCPPLTSPSLHFFFSFLFPQSCAQIILA